MTQGEFVLQYLTWYATNGCFVFPSSRGHISHAPRKCFHNKMVLYAEVFTSTGNGTFFLLFMSHSFCFDVGGGGGGVGDAILCGVLSPNLYAMHAKFSTCIVVMELTIPIRSRFFFPHIHPYALLKSYLRRFSVVYFYFFNSRNPEEFIHALLRRKTCWLNLDL